MNDAARELHRQRTLTGRARKNHPQPFKPPAGKKVADWIPSALTAVWSYVFSPWRFSDLEKINNLFRTKSLERRIAIALVAQVMIYCKDTLTLWAAYPKNKGEFVGRGVEYLAKQTGLSLSAVKGALKDMCDAKIIKTFRRHKRTDGGAVPTTAIRLVRVKLFEVFGIAHLMNEARKAAANKLIDKLTPLITAGKSITSWLYKRFEVAQSILVDPALEVSPTSALLP